MNNRGHLPIIIFVAIQLCLYVLFLFVLEGSAVAYCQYASIALCFVYALIFAGRGRDALFVKAALLLTLAADFFLVIVQKAELGSVAMAIFTGAQLCYLLRLMQAAKGKKRAVMMWIHLILMGVLMIASRLIIGSYNTLLVICCLYFGTLITSVIFSWQGKNRIFAIGITLFLCCDIFVALQGSTEFLNLDMGWMNALPVDPIWFFYLPAQMTLALSAKKEKVTK